MPLTRSLALILAATLALAACGGGGGGGAEGGAGNPPPVVTLGSVSSVKYGETMLVTLTGSRLDQGLTLSSNGCRDFVLGTTAPNVSTATTAYYTCRVNGVGAQTVSVVGGGAALATVPFTIAMPQVSMTIGNGAGVNGTLVVDLRPDLVQLTVDNFLAYVKAGFYNGTVIHRNAPGFVLQGGGYAAPVGTGALPVHKPTGAAIALEVGRGLSNTRYTLAMARTAAADSATSEFFINTVDNSAVLDPNPSTLGYAVFGVVSTNRALVDAMVGAPCSAAAYLGAGECLPLPNLVVSSAVQTR